MRIALFVKDDEKSRQARKLIEEKLQNRGHIFRDNSDCDLALAVGGDGTFLRMVKECNFSSNIMYVGINSGTLGFLEEIKIEEMDDFLDELENGYYKTENIGIQKTIVYHANGISTFYSFNEIVIRRENLKLLKADVLIDGNLLEHFVGDGLLISTSQGSTAYNLSYGGSIVMDTCPTLQITPMAPISTKAYHSLPNSVIVGRDKIITVCSHEKEKDFILTIDGENIHFEGVERIETCIANQKITCMRLSHHNFPQKIYEKLLSN